MKIKLDFCRFFWYIVCMIKVIKNANFQGWFNVMLNGELVDNARTHAKALVIAKKLEKKLPNTIPTGARLK